MAAVESVTEDDMGYFEVTPLSHSPGLATIASSLPDPGSIAMDTPCQDCGHVGDVMLCLYDNSVRCGRHANGCMLKHCQSQNLPCKIVIGFLDLSVWDYAQDAYLDSFLIPQLHPHFNFLHQVKFDEPASLPPPAPAAGSAAAGGSVPGPATLRLEITAPPGGASAESSGDRLPPNAEDRSTDANLARIRKVLSTSLSPKELSVEDPTNMSSRDRDINRYRVCGAVGAADRASVMAAVNTIPELDRAVGAVAGMAIADAVGAPLEFLPATDTPKPPYVCSITHPAGPDGAPHSKPGLFPHYEAWYNKFQLKPGQWTDDAAMGLCMADSLILKGKYDGSDVRTRFYNWWFRGYNNAFRKEARRSGSVGLGGNISRSIYSCKPGLVPSPTFQRKNNDAGNGSLMRLAPVPVAFHHDVTQAMHFAALSSYTTHPGPMAAEACAFLARAIVTAIHPPPPPPGLASGSQGTQTDGTHWPARHPAAFLDMVAREHCTWLASRTLTGSHVRVATEVKGKTFELEGSIVGYVNTKKGMRLTVKWDGTETWDGTEPGARAAGHTLQVPLEDITLMPQGTSPASGHEQPRTLNEDMVMSSHAMDTMVRLLRSEEPDTSKERCWNWRADTLDVEGTMQRRGSSYNGYPVSAGYFGSFCMDGLAMALWSVRLSNSFASAVERCVNLLGDADSTGSMAGQLAGAIYGYTAIDPRLVQNLEAWDDGDTALRGALLYCATRTTATA